jgi:hypothetical protein
MSNLAGLSIGHKTLDFGTGVAALKSKNKKRKK